MSDDPNAPEIGKNPQRPLGENDVFETPDTVVSQTGAFGDDVFEADDFEDIDDSAQNVDYDADASYQDVSGEAVDDVYAVASDLDTDDEADAFDNVADDQDFSLDNYDGDLGDEDVFAEDWGDELDASDSEATQTKGKAPKKSGAAMALAGGGSKKILTYAGGGIGAVVAVAAVYFGLLGGTLPMPQQQPAQQQAEQQTNQSTESVNTQMAQQAVSPEPIEAQASTSLFDSLDSLPAPVISEELVKKNKEKNFDPNADIFSLLNDPAQQPASDTGGLPMPAPISTTGNTATTPTEATTNVTDGGMLPSPTSTDTTANNTGTATQPAEDDPWAMFNTQDNAPAKMATAQDTGQETTQATLDAPVSGTQDNISLDDFMAPAPADVSGDVAPIAMPSDAPSDFEKPQQQDMAAIAPTQQQPQQEPTQESLQTPPAVQTQINQLSNRMDSLDRKLDDILAAQNGSGGSDLSRIESTLQRLEKRIEDIATNKPAAAQASASSKRSSSASASKSTSSTKSSVRKASVPKSSKAAAPKNLSGNWALRGASPGEALISKKGTSSSIHTVRIGDSVAGLGTVQFIGIDGGRWVVRTTGGTLSQ